MPNQIVAPENMKYPAKYEQSTNEGFRNYLKTIIDNYNEIQAYVFTLQQEQEQPANNNAAILNTYANHAMLAINMGIFGPRQNLPALPIQQIVRNNNMRDNRNRKISECQQRMTRLESAVNLATPANFKALPKELLDNTNYRPNRPRLNNPRP